MNDKELVFRIPTNPRMEIWRRKKNHHLLILVRCPVCYKMFMPNEKELLEGRAERHNRCFSIYNHYLERKIYGILDMYNYAVGKNGRAAKLVFKKLKLLMEDLKRTSCGLL